MKLVLSTTGYFQISTSNYKSDRVLLGLLSYLAVGCVEYMHQYRSDAVVVASNLEVPKISECFYGWYFQLQCFFKRQRPVISQFGFFRGYPRTLRSVVSSTCVSTEVMTL